MASGPLPLYLASRSPRRRALLAAWGHPCRPVPPGPEPRTLPGLAPEEAVLALARAKCEGARLAGLPPGLVLAADTLVVAPGGELLGKPAGREEARAALQLLLGGTHRVLTGVWGRRHPEGPARGGVETSRVTFRALPAPELEDYLAGGEWRGKAGGYALQGVAGGWVAALAGEAENVVGLPRRLTEAVLAWLAGS